MDEFYKYSLQKGDKTFEVKGKQMSAIKNSEMPRKLYKYYRISDFLFEMLTESKIYHAGKDNFNDPLDGINNYKLEFDENDIMDAVLGFSEGKSKLEIEKEKCLFFNNPGQFESIIQMLFGESLGTYGVSCFTNTNTNFLMWSHYGDSHKGVCIEFDFINEIPLIKEKMIDLPFCFFIRKVNYANDVPLVSYKNLKKEVFSPIYHKGKVWEYEKEYRSIRPSIGTFPFDRSCLTGIYFGLNTAPNMQEKIRTLADKEYKNVSYKKIIHKSNSYDLVSSQI